MVHDSSKFLHGDSVVWCKAPSHCNWCLVILLILLIKLLFLSYTFIHLVNAQKASQYLFIYFGLVEIGSLETQAKYNLQIK